MKFITICTVATLVLALTIDAAPSPKLTKRRISKQNPEVKTESTTTSISSAVVVTEGPQPTVPAPVVQHPTTASPLQAPGVPQIPELVSTAIPANPAGQLPQLPGQSNGTTTEPSTTAKPEEEGEEDDSSSEEDPDTDSPTPPEGVQSDDEDEEDESQEDEENSVEEEDEEARSHIKAPAAANAIVDDEAQEDGSDSDEVAEVPSAAVKVSSTVPKKKPISEKKTTPVKPAVPVKEAAEVSEESVEEEDEDKEAEASEVVEEEKEAASEEAEESASVGSSEEVDRKKVKKPSVSPVVAASIEEPVLNQNVDATGEIPFIRPPPLALVREKVPTGEDDEHEGFVEKARFYLPDFDDEEPRVYSPYNFQPHWFNPYNNWYNNW